MKSRPEDRLQTALEASASGRSLEEITAGLSQGEAAELHSLLAAVAAAKTLGPSGVPVDAARRSRSRLLRKAAAQPTRGRAGPNLRVLLPRFSAAALVAAVALLGLGGLNEAAATSLPGDVLYPVKVAAADLRLRLEFEAAQHQRLESLLAEQRLEDVRSFLALGRVAPVSWQGRVRSIGALWWNVEDMLVEVTPRTRVVGAVLPGRVVEVEGVSQPDGTILANELRLIAYDLLGTIQAVDDSQMTVDGQVLRLTAQSVIEPGLGVGQRALLRVAMDKAGTPSVVSAVLFAPPTPTAITAPFRTPAAGATVAPAVPTDDHSGPGGGTTEAGEDEDGASGPSETDESPEEGGGDSQKIQFEGLVESISGSIWVIDGRTIRVNGETEVKDNPGLGDNVKVVAFLQSDGTWWAEKVELED